VVEVVPAVEIVVVVVSSSETEFQNFCTKTVHEKERQSFNSHNNYI